MVQKSPLGHMACPECGFPDAEIKADKNGNPYRYCPDCSAQYMTHGRPHKVANLTARMRPIAAAVQALPGQPPEQPPEQPPKQPAPRRFML